MDAEEIIARAMAICASLPRPAHFADPGHCCECAEHDAELQPYSPVDLPRAALGTMGWDPVTFVSDDAFRYLLPGLVRVVLTEQGEDSYYEQFLWHLNASLDGLDRRAACTDAERAMVHRVLEFLLEHRADDIETEGLSEDLLSALERWDDPPGEGPE